MIESFSIKPLRQDLALEIADQWKYPAPYDFYDATADPEDYAELVSDEARGNRYFAVLKNASLMGYFCVFPTEIGLELGLGMKPSLIGQGNGRAFYQTIEAYLRDNYDEKIVELSVAAFNERAYHLYRQCGFEETERYLQATNGGHYPFIKMKKELKDEIG